MRRLWLFPLFIMLAVYACFYKIGGFGFIDPYETIYAGNYLHNYMNVLIFNILGKSEFAGRIVQVILGIAGVFLTYLSAKYLTTGRKAAHIAAFITLTSPLYFTVSHLSVPDILFAFAFTLTVFGYVCTAHGNEKSGTIIFYIGMALASLSAGFIRGTIAPLIIAFSHIYIVHRRIMSVTSGVLNFWKVIKNYFTTLKSIFFNKNSLIGVIIYTLIVSPIFLNNYRLNDIYFINTLISNLKYNSILSYIIIILVSIFPWDILSHWAFKSLDGNFTISREDAYLTGLWAVAAFVAGFPNFAVCVPPIAVLTASAIIEEIVEYPVRSIARSFCFYLLCVTALIVLVFNIHTIRAVAVTKSHRDIAKMALDYLKYESITDIISYGNAMPGLSFYLNRDVASFNSQSNQKNEVATRNERQRLRRIWNGAKQVLLVTRKSDAAAFQRFIGREPVKVGESAGDILFTNY